MNAAETRDPKIVTLVGPSQDVVTHPLVMIDDQKILPRDYIVHHRSQKCLNCGHIHEWCDTYARNEVPANFNIGTVLNLVPVQRFRFNLPIHIVKIEARPVPVCHLCKDSISLSHLPDPRDTEEWQRVVKRKQAQEASVATSKLKPKSKEPKRPPSLSDIEGDLL